MAEKKTLIFDGYSRRLDIYVCDELETFPRALVQRMIKDGKVTVNGKQVKPSWPLTPGEKVEIEMPSAAKTKIQLKDLLIHDDEDFFVIAKPAGLLVPPQSPVWETNPQAVFSFEETLVSVILATPPAGFDLSTPRAGLVHRLDRETSGVMVIAKNAIFQNCMTELFANRQIRKTYYSIACGEIPDDEGVINVPIGRVAGGKIKASDMGREAITEYKVLERKNGFTRVQLHPVTGRTNQLRVHLSWLGYPVLGDWLYKGATADRLMLHSRRVEFAHPYTGEPLRFEAPVPPDFTAAWERVSTAKK